MQWKKVLTLEEKQINNYLIATVLILQCGCSFRSYCPSLNVETHFISANQRKLILLWEDISKMEIGEMRHLKMSIF